MRYVADAPLAALKSDLGLSTAKTTSRSRPDARANQMQIQLDKLNEKLNEQKREMKAIAVIARSNPAIAYVQNLTTLAIHGLRAGDATVTVCGWPVGPKIVKMGAIRFLHSLKGECWETLCERCLKPEREAAMAFEDLAISKLENSSAKAALTD